MSVALAPLLAVLAYASALAGWRLLKDPGPEDRFEATQVQAAPSGPARGPLIRLLHAAGGRTQGLLRGVYADPRRAARARRRIDAAGRPWGLTSVDEYVRLKAGGLTVLGTIAVLGALQGDLVVVGLSLLLGAIAVDVLLDGAGRRRQARIDRDLPDFLDVLAVCAGAGIAFRPAMERVAAATGGPLGEEVDLTLRQVALGASRRGAFEGLRERNPSEPLGVFVSSFLQAEELGVPLAEALTDLARDMRRDSAQRARRRAQNTVPKVSLVIVFTILPAAILLLLGALFLQSGIGDALGGL